MCLQGGFQHLQIVFHDGKIRDSGVSFLLACGLHGIQGQNPGIFPVGIADHRLCKIRLAAFQEDDGLQLMCGQFFRKGDNSFEACLGFRGAAREGGEAFYVIIMGQITERKAVCKEQNRTLRITDNRFIFPIQRLQAAVVALQILFIFFCVGRVQAAYSICDAAAGILGAAQGKPQMFVVFNFVRLMIILVGMGISIVNADVFFVAMLVIVMGIMSHSRGKLFLQFLHMIQKGEHCCIRILR